MSEWKWIDSAVEFAQDGSVSGEWERCKAEIAALRTQLDAWREREARCCPEDVGFEEVIAALRAKVERMERVVEAAKRLYHGHPQTTAEEYNSAWNGLRDALIALDAGLEVDRG